MTFTGPNLHETGHSMSKFTKHNWSDTIHNVPSPDFSSLSCTINKLYHNIWLVNSLSSSNDDPKLQFWFKTYIVSQDAKSTIFCFGINLSLMRFPARRVRREGKCQKYLK